MALIETTIIRLKETGFDLTALKQLFQDYLTFLEIDLTFQNFQQELDQLPSKYAPSHRGQLYLAQYEGQFVGCAGLYQFSETIAEVKRVYVDPNYQGKGIGRALMEVAIADAKAFGYEQLYLDSLKRLGNARRLYEKLGFVEIPPYNVNPYDDVYYMALDLI